MNKEQLIKKINDIVANEKFKLDAYFLCGFPTDKPNDELKAACEKYLETLEDKESNKAAAEATLKASISTIEKAGTKGVYHKNNVARKVSRLSKMVAAMK